MTTERSVPERLAIRVLRSADVRLWFTNGELVWGLATEFPRPPIYTFGILAG